MELNKVHRDFESIQAGQWVSDIPDMGDLKVRVRGFTSPVVMEVRSRKERNVPRDERERDGSLSVAAAIRVTREVLAEVVLLDINGLTDEGKEVSVEQAREYLVDPYYEPLADAVAWAARAVDRGMAESKETAAGNSRKRSGGS